MRFGKCGSDQLQFWGAVICILTDSSGRFTALDGFSVRLRPGRSRSCEQCPSGGTPHRLARGFFGRPRRAEDGAGFQHGTGDVKEAVGDNHADLVAGAGAGLPLTGAASERILANDDIAALFGLEIETSVVAEEPVDPPAAEDRSRRSRKMPSRKIDVRIRPGTQVDAT